MKNKYQLLTLTPDKYRDDEIRHEEMKAFRTQRPAGEPLSLDNLQAAITLREEIDTREALLARLHEGTVDAKREANGEITYSVCPNLLKELGL
jgi:hypothetical protein